MQGDLFIIKIGERRTRKEKEKKKRIEAFQMKTSGRCHVLVAMQGVERSPQTLSNHNQVLHFNKIDIFDKMDSK